MSLSGGSGTSWPLEHVRITHGANADHVCQPDACIGLLSLTRIAA